MSVPNAQLYGAPQTNLERLGLVRLADGVPNVLLATREALATGSVYLKLMAGGGISSTRKIRCTPSSTPRKKSLPQSKSRGTGTPTYPSMCTVPNSLSAPLEAA